MTYCKELTQSKKNVIVNKITQKNYKWRGNSLYFNNELVYSSNNAQAIIDYLEFNGGDSI